MRTISRRGKTPSWREAGVERGQGRPVRRISQRRAAGRRAQRACREEPRAARRAQWAVTMPARYEKSMRGMLQQFLSPEAVATGPPWAAAGQLRGAQAAAVVCARREQGGAWLLGVLLHRRRQGRKQASQRSRNGLPASWLMPGAMARVHAWDADGNALTQGSNPWPRPPRRQRWPAAWALGACSPACSCYRGARHKVCGLDGGLLAQHARGTGMCGM